MSEAIDFNRMAIVRVVDQSWRQADKHEQKPVLLQPLAGSIPRKEQVVAGTLANNAGWEVGSVHWIAWHEKEPDPQYGRQFDLIEEMEILDDENKLIVKSSMSPEEKADVRQAYRDHQTEILGWISYFGQPTKLEEPELNKMSEFKAPEASGQNVVPDQD